VFAFYIFAVGFVLIRCRKWFAERPLIMWPMVGVPVLLAVVSLLWKPVFLFRALIPSAGLFCIALGYALETASYRTKQIAVTALTAVMAVGCLSFPAHVRQDWPGVLQPMRDKMQPSDSVFFTSIDAAILLGYYMPGADIYLWQNAGDNNQRLLPQTETAMGFRLTDLATVCQNHSRVWYPEALAPLSEQTELDEAKQILSSYRILFHYTAQDQPEAGAHTEVYLLECT